MPADHFVREREAVMDYAGNLILILICIFVSWIRHYPRWVRLAGIAALAVDLLLLALTYWVLPRFGGGGISAAVMAVGLCYIFFSGAAGCVLMIREVFRRAGAGK